MGLCLVISYKRSYPKGEVVPFKEALKIAAGSFWGLLTVVIILGGILSGRLHRDRGRFDRLRLRLLRHDVHLPGS